ncbi:MAG: hypothetical protein RL662_2314 [Bacteroidota bacterium]|jgi:radical SAM superfamily enzyme YgiQ (UPF0313 family)
MKTVLATINAKYIHTSLALRWLYVANKDRFDISFKEFTLKDTLDNIVSSILDSNCDIVGLGVYIWNVKQTKQLVCRLRQAKPQLIIILGGPEVTYEPDFFITNWDIDYVISGEGEFVLGELIYALENKLSDQLAGVSSKSKISNEVVQADMQQLARLESPYTLDEDKEDLKNRLIYFETSRGCPYQCQYCLSSLEKGVRYFDRDYIFSNLKQLIDNRVRQLKFLDRTFNLNREHTLAVFDFLLEHHRENLVCQFEIYADLLHPDIIEYINTQLPKDFFRFEIGIQSTYEPTNVAVKRKQNFELLADNVRKLILGGKIDFHLDLIAGLPYETFPRFSKSFNDVFVLRAKEVQLGFLKMLRGTALRKGADAYGYVYDTEAPYEIRSNDSISEQELDRIHGVEHALEKYWNSGRFKRTMNRLCDEQYAGRYFELFDEIGQYYTKHKLPHMGYQLEDLFRTLDSFLNTKGIDLFDELRFDYYANFSQRPTGFWKQDEDRKSLKKILYGIGQDKDFLEENNLTRKIIEKQTAIYSMGTERYELVVFLPTTTGCLRKALYYTENKDIN